MTGKVGGGNFPGDITAQPAPSNTELERLQRIERAARAVQHFNLPENDPYNTGAWEAAWDELHAALAEAAPARDPERNPDCVDCASGLVPEWAADGVTPCHRVGTAAIKCPVAASEETP